MSAKKRHISIDIDDKLRITVRLAYGRNARHDVVGVHVCDGYVADTFWCTALGTTTSRAPLAMVGARDEWLRRAWRWLECAYNEMETSGWDMVSQSLREEDTK